MAKVLIDTNCLLDYPNIFNNIQDEIIIHSIVLEEIDNIIHNSSSEEKKYKARQARNAIKKAKNIEYSLRIPSYSMPTGWDYDKNDNKLLCICKDMEYILITNDLAMQLKATNIGVEWREYGDCKTDDIYQGYKKICGDTDFINILHDNIKNGINEYDFVTNEYLIEYNTDLDEVNEYRYDGNELIGLRLPPSKIIKGMNSLQRCALDLLNNKDIPIKIIAGGFGSGKTMCAVKTGLYLAVDKEIYKSITFIRNPISADNADIGFLPGTKDEKIYDYCRPFLQYIHSNKDQDYVNTLIKNEKINMDVVSFLKGVSIDDSFVIVDEAEDLNKKLIKLVGSRIGEKSCIVFTGDWQQAENKYRHDNGLTRLINGTKGNPLVGTIVLEEDVRSSASKVFADL